MNNVRELENAHMPLRDFWLTTGPVTSGILLLTVIIIIWTRPISQHFRAYVRRKLGRPPKQKTNDLEKQTSHTFGSQGRTTNAVQTQNGSPYPSRSAQNHPPTNIPTHLARTAAQPVAPTCSANPTSTSDPTRDPPPSPPAREPGVSLPQEAAG